LASLVVDHFLFELPLLDVLDAIVPPHAPLLNLCRLLPPLLCKLLLELVLPHKVSELLLLLLDALVCLVGPLLSLC
jgi:hypothetical protein